MPPVTDDRDTDGPVLPLTEEARLLIDNAAYFGAAREALLSARQQVWIVGWQFEPQTRLRPDIDDETLGGLLKRIADERPELDLRVLIWRAALPIALAERGMPFLARPYFRDSRVDFRLDDSHPFGASEHQKLVVVDDETAFCTGADFVSNRWDRWVHADEEPARTNSWSSATPPRHAAALSLTGAAAAQLGAIARRRWARATGENVAAVHAAPEEAASAPPIRILRTEPAFRDVPEIREAEAHSCEVIRQAGRTIYLENQYFSSGRIARLLAARLAEPEGPDVILITGRRAPSPSDRLTMDPPRDALIHWLRANDPHRRLGIFAPHTEGGDEVLVHSKLIIADDRLIRVGSANLSNRSFGYDSECDVSIEGLPPGRVTSALYRLISHFFRCPEDKVSEAVQAAGGHVAQAVRQLAQRNPGLQELQVRRPRFLRRLIATYHLGDPLGPDDAWRPWRRPSLPSELRGEASLHCPDRAGVPSLAYDTGDALVDSGGR